MLTETARKIIRSLNADAKPIEADFAEVALGEVLDTGRFDFDRAHEHPLWAKELDTSKNPCASGGLMIH